MFLAFLMPKEEALPPTAKILITVCWEKQYNIPEDLKVS
jgi:hypothetical protein